MGTNECQANNHGWRSTPRQYRAVNHIIVLLLLNKHTLLEDYRSNNWSSENQHLTASHSLGGQWGLINGLKPQTEHFISYINGALYKNVYWFGTN